MIDSIYYNGHIITLDGERPHATALAVSGGRIRAVGGDEELLRLAAPNTLRFDLSGAYVVPGLSDTLMHLLSLGQSFRSADLSSARSIGEMQAILRDFMRAHPEGDVRGRGWNQDLFMEKRLPTREDLDLLSTERPIVLTRVCGHMVVCNSAALKKYGVDENTAVRGGTVERDASGRLNGLLTENAVSLVQGGAGASVEEIKALLRPALAHCASLGLTAVSSEDFCSLPGAGFEDVLAAYAELEKEDALPLRVYLQAQLPDRAALDAFFQKGLGFGSGGRMHRIVSLKLLADGSLGARTALLSAPYADDPGNTGVAVYTQAELDELIAVSHEHGLPVTVHAIGDRAMHMVLDSIEKAQAACPSPLRHGIIHCQITDEKLLDRFRELGVQALVQPIFLEYDAHIAAERVGGSLASTSYNWDGFLRRGVPVSGGTDCPVESVNPLWNLYCAITRTGFDGRPQGGFCPEHCLTPAQALSLLTTAAAYAVGEERRRGRLRSGFLADFTVLDVDPLSCPPERLLSAKALMTVVDGRPRYVADARQTLTSSPIPAFGSVEEVLSPDTRDSGEDMLDVTELDPRVVFDRSYLKMGVPGAIDRCYMRRGAFEHLLRALELLGEGYGFLIYDALRPLRVQKALFDQQLAVVKAREPGISEEEAVRQTREFVALPKRDQKHPSTHMTGGAVDLTLTFNGEPLDMGTGFDDFRENAHSAFYEREGLSDEDRAIRDNRRLLHNALLSVGFTNYESEWWHYDYGDVSWAALRGKTPMYGHYDI